ncbi:MAG TPA: YcxB family protein [Polyangiaceae bacterium]
MSGEVVLSLADVEAGLSALPRAKIAKTISWVGAAAVIGMVAYRWMEGRDRTALVMIGALLLVLLVTNRNPARRIAKRVYASLDDASRRMRITVDDEGFRVATNGNESLLPWSDVRRCVDSRTVFVVFVSQHDAQILPKRAFSDADQRRIRELSKSKILERNEPWLTPELRKRMLLWLAVFAVVWTAFTLFGHR